VLGILLRLSSALLLTRSAWLIKASGCTSWFVQDDYRISSKLKLNFGPIRIFNASFERDSRLANFDPSNGAVTFAKAGSTFDRTLNRSGSQ
jgi:hypothetical protein